VLILDEPTEGLDPSQRAEVRSLIRGLAGKHTLILSTHILPEVTMTCEKVLIINQGKMVAYDEIKNLASVHGQSENVSLEEIFIKLTAA
jgi:ABC-2 type transport system ATP-binding protein